MDTQKPWNRTSMERVAVLPWPGIDGAYLVLSGSKRAQTRLVGEEWRKHDDLNMEEPRFFRGGVESDPHITFTFHSGNVIAEWDGSYGPIQLWFKCEQISEGARAHWFFEWATGTGHWSQLAVSDNGLPDAFIRGDYSYIFTVLRSWAVDRDTQTDAVTAAEKVEVA